jgi:hypothetical protein
MLFFGSNDEILYEETFSGATSGDWYVGATGSFNWWTDNGKYYTLVKEAVFTVSPNGTEGPFVDAQIDLDVDHILGTPGQSGGGLIFRVADANNLYAFLVSPVGKFIVMKWVAGKQSTLLAWAESPAVNKGATRNHLTVVAIGPSLSFLVNKTEVAMLTDTSYTAGGVGVIAVAYDAAVDVLEGFDNLIVQTAE